MVVILKSENKVSLKEKIKEKTQIRLKDKKSQLKPIMERRK
jgi:hypothetical protein